MRWPFISRKAHEAALKTEQLYHDNTVAGLSEQHERYIAMIKDRFQLLVDNEYERARNEGTRLIHAWAVEVNYGIFKGQGDFNTRQRTWVAAALQDAEKQFKPSRTQVQPPKEIH